MQRRWVAVFLALALGSDASVQGQPPTQESRRMMGSPRGPGGEETPLVGRFDLDGDGRLNATERGAAREFIRGERAEGRARAGPVGPRGGFGARPNAEPARPGPRVAPSEAEHFPEADLFDTAVLRTFFLEFESDDWESELEDFYNTDVEVPATLLVDGVRYPGVGVHFRGASSYFMVPRGGKRSLNLSLDFTDPGQRLYGHRTVNLLNSHGDPSFMSTVLYSSIARRWIPAPHANFARVVINGESWGVYVSVEQFNGDFVEAHFDAQGHEGNGARWRVKGSPNGASGLDYIGDDIEAYRRRYQIKSRDEEQDWQDLINLCRILSATPLDRLEQELTPILDLEGVLWFLALDVALVNSDGYWVRASDYSLYKDPAGVFHVIPHDMNESFALAGRRGPGGPPRPPAGDGRPGPEPDRGRPGRPGRAGVTLDPLVAMDDARKPLRSRLLAVPSLRERYLANLRLIAQESLDWSRLGPQVAGHRSVIAAAVEADTRKPMTLAEFDRATSDEPGTEGGLRAFAERRSAYLMTALEALREGEVPGGEGIETEPPR